MSSVTVRSLLPAGIEAFRAWLHQGGPGVSRPPSSDEVLSTAVTPRALVDPDTKFKDRYEMGEYLVAALKPLSASPALRDDGVWAWLSLVWFDQLKSTKAGSVGADDRFIPNTIDQRRRIRHLVRTNYELVALHGEASQLLLRRPVNQHGEDTEQLLGRRQLSLNQSLFRALATLYLRPTGVARGARSKSGGGTYRRLGKVERQFDLTFDLQSMSPTEILDLLPKEFDRFRRM